MLKEQIRLNGIVKNIIYFNPDNGYTILEIGYDNNLIPAVGTFPYINTGDHLSVIGMWSTHKDYGRQFKIEQAEILSPNSSAQIKQYLESGAVHGIGPVIATRIIEAFGENSLNIIENDYFRLAEIKGISMSKAEEISSSYRKQSGLRATMMFLQQFGISSAECIRIHKLFGMLTKDIITNDPYILSIKTHMSFDEVDSIAMQLGFDTCSEKRFMAGVLYVLSHNCSKNGHTFIPKHKIAPVTAQMLGQPQNEVETAIEQLIDNESIYCEEIDDIDCLFLPKCYRAECYIARRLCSINSIIPYTDQDYDKFICALEKQFEIEYALEQRDAINCALQRSIVVLTGGPGTGKTTVIRGILEGYKSLGFNVCLTAPTGRAAKRMAETTGYEAKTIHRLLEAGVDDYGMSIFGRNDNNPLDYNAIILDETSMVDVFLFEALLHAMKSNCRLVLAGDSDQLPSVGPGNILHDIINSGLVPCVRLEHIFRQAQESLIVTNSHHVIAGDMPILNRTDSDFFFIPAQSDSIVANTICDLVSRRLPQAYGLNSAWDIQVICPSKKGYTGTTSLNAALQQALNPPSSSLKDVTLRGTVFREGDKIMQLRNNYDIKWESSNDSGMGIYNGDIGVVVKIHHETSEMYIEVEDKLYHYPFALADDIELAYAVTVHKSQGSEFDTVVMPVCNVPSKLVNRNLFYTGITRAKRMIVLVGSKDTVAAMVNNTDKNARYTGLCEFLYREN